MNIDGENLNGVYSANEFLTRVNLMKSYLFPNMIPDKERKTRRSSGRRKRSHGLSRCALRLGADEVTIVYRRGEKELPARAEEVEHAKEEGIKFRLLTNPVRILGDAGTGSLILNASICIYANPMNQADVNPCLWQDLNIRSKLMLS